MSSPSMPPIQSLPGMVTRCAFDHTLEDALRAETASGMCAISAARRYRGFSVGQLADRSALGRARIAAIEGGERPSRDEIARCSQALNIPPALLAR